MVSVPFLWYIINKFFCGYKYIISGAYIRNQFLFKSDHNYFIQKIMINLNTFFGWNIVFNQLFELLE